MTLGRLISLFCFSFPPIPLTSSFSNIKSKCRKLLAVLMLCQVFQTASVVTKSRCKNLNWAKHHWNPEINGIS